MFNILERSAKKRALAGPGLPTLSSLSLRLHQLNVKINAGAESMSTERAATDERRCSALSTPRRAKCKRRTPLPAPCQVKKPPD